MNVNSYADVEYLDTDRFWLPIGINGKLLKVDIINQTIALSISPSGYAVHSKWFNGGGITGRPWGSSIISSGNAWPELNNYMSWFVDSNGDPIINILEDDMVYQEGYNPPPECNESQEGSHWCDGYTNMICRSGQWEVYQENAESCGYDYGEPNIGFSSLKIYSSGTMTEVADVNSGDLLDFRVSVYNTGGSASNLTIAIKFNNITIGNIPINDLGYVPVDHALEYWFNGYSVGVPEGNYTVCAVLS